MNPASPALPSEEPFLPDYLQYLLATASGLASHPFHQQVIADGLAVAEWRVMACLWGTGGQMVTELARKAQMEQSRLTRVIERMEQRGLVKRERSREDRRKVLVTYAPEGRRIAADLVTRAHAQEEAFLKAHLTDAEGKNLKHLLSRLIDSASREIVSPLRRG